MKGFLERTHTGPGTGPVGLQLLTAAALAATGLLFVWAAYPKIAEPEAFAFITYSYRVLPDRYVNLVAIVLPWLELVCGLVLILVPRWRVAAGLLILGMLMVFSGLLISAVARGIEITCGCLSTDAAGDLIGWRNVARNVLFSLASVYVIWAHAGERGRFPGRPAGQRPRPEGR